MSTPPPNQVFDHLNSPDFAQFAVSDRSEIVALLERLAAARTRANVYFNTPPGSMLTMLLAVDPRSGTFVFDVDSDPRRNEAAAAADALAWRTSLDGVTLEFTTESAKMAAHDARPALLSLVPDLVLRLQRRNAFRAETPVATPLHVMLDLSGSGGNEKQARVLDISALGMSLLVDLRSLPLFAGMKIVHSRFELPGIGEIHCGLEVRYILSAGARHPDYMRRCGARFVNVSFNDERLISRYIHSLERERAKLKGAAMGALSG